MLHLCSASHARRLAEALAEVLASPPEDPMTPEWVAVPTVGMRRWLALELARSLGASHAGATDGVAANIAFSFPGALGKAVIEAGRPGEPGDPWRVEHLVWSVLEVLADSRDDERLGPLARLAQGATWFARARRLADLFDRYSVRRPELLLAWHAGHDVDGNGRPLPAHDRWQPHLWRLVRAHLATPSPPELMPGLLEQLREGTLVLDLPGRLAIFGLTTLPGGAPFIELLEAVASGREVHLMLLDPSPATSSRVRGATLAGPRPVARLRAEDGSDGEVRHPLISSWGRPYQERAVLLAGAESPSIPAAVLLDESVTADDPAPRLLARLQSDLRAGNAPAGDFELAMGDRSVQVHSCHGEARQVEVLRDAILHLLDDDPTLSENEIVVLCPAINDFAPLVEAGFGTSADRLDSAPGACAPRLFYRIADRSLRESCPLLAALDSLLGLVAGRFSASEMLEFVALAPVRRRFGLDDEATSKISEWIAQTNVRWGLDGAHRARWGLPPQFTANSWRAGIDRLLTGIATSDEGLSLAPGDIAPFRVEGDDLSVAGRLADIVARLAAIEADMRKPRTVAAWCATLSEVTGELFAVEDSGLWQLDQLRALLADIGDEAQVEGRQAMVELSLAEIRRLLDDRLKGAPRRADFFRGGITVSSLTPLRWLPFRVVCILGLDEAATSGNGFADGDDLAAATPFIGDHDARAEARQALLEAVLAAGDHLVITRTGHNVRTNQKVPMATVLAELRDTISTTLSPEERVSGWDRIETVHPCQAFDDRCFTAEALNHPGPWSFDAGAFAGAVARARRCEHDPPFLASPLGPYCDEGAVIRLDDLRSFLDHPVKAFMRQRLQLHLAGDDRDVSDDLVTSLGPLECWGAGERLIRAQLSDPGSRATSQWRRHERGLGTLPPGGLGELALDEIDTTVEGLLSMAAGLGLDNSPRARLPVDVELADGTRIVGEVTGQGSGPTAGTALVSYSRVTAKQRLRAWLELEALIATDPETDWRNVVVGRDEREGKLRSLVLNGRGETPDDRRKGALDALAVAVDCYRRGMREPIPLFATFSRKLYTGRAKADDWDAERGLGARKDEANRVAFGRLDFTQLLALAAREDDPPGQAVGRALRFACYLWRAVDDSVVEP